MDRRAGIAGAAGVLVVGVVVGLWASRSGPAPAPEPSEPVADPAATARRQQQIEALVTLETENLTLRQQVEAARARLEAVSGPVWAPGRGMFAPEVREGFVARWERGVGVELSPTQRHQLTQWVTATVAREDLLAAPTPEPLPYAWEVRQDVARTLDLERKLEELLTPEQLAVYLRAVGSDPLASGLGLTVERATCTGETVWALAASVVEHWRAAYGVAGSGSIDAAARRFVAKALALPAPDASQPLIAQRRVQLQSTLERLTAQGQAERELLREARPSQSDARCPVLLLP